MSLAAFPPGLERVLRGDFGEAWLEVTAAGCGIDHGRPSTTDLKKADVQLTLREEVSGVMNPTVLVQVKTTVGLREHGQDHWAYDLDADTHDVLRRTNHQTRRILAVIELSADGETLRMEPDGTLLVGRTAWVSLENEVASSNDTQQVVYLPKDNLLDPEGLRVMLTNYGVPRSSQVPEIDPWGGEE